ncbi:MAG: hypothetical protein ACXVYY_01030 [Oryzihumus sp.]
MRRDDPPGQPVHELEPAVPVEVAVDNERWPGLAHSWRGAWVYCSWSRGPGLNHLGWLPGTAVTRR